MPHGTPVRGDGNADGTQSIRRAASILRRIAQASTEGAKLSAISSTLDLPRSTAHRILKCLVDEGFVSHDHAKRRYFLGHLTHELGLAVPPDLLDVAKWRPVVEKVARRTGATSYLMARSGSEAVCLVKSEGSSVIRVIPVEVGQRRFLGLGAGATALLAGLAPDDAEAVIRSIAPYLEKDQGPSEDDLRELVANTRKTGFAVSRGNVVKDVIGLGMAIPNRNGVPLFSISIASLASQVDQKRLEFCCCVLKEEIGAVLEAEPA